MARDTIQHPVRVNADDGHVVFSNDLGVVRMLRAGNAFDVENLADEWLLAGRLNSNHITSLDGQKDWVHGALQATL